MKIKVFAALILSFQVLSCLLFKMQGSQLGAEFSKCYYQRWSPRGRPWPRGRPRGHILKSLALALASKPQVLGLGLGLEALGPRKSPCPRLEDSTIFEPLKFC